MIHLSGQRNLTALFFLQNEENIDTLFVSDDSADEQEKKDAKRKRKKKDQDSESTTTGKDTADEGVSYPSRFLLVFCGCISACA